MENKKGIIDIIKYKWLWIAITIILLLPGILAMGYSTYKNKTPLLLGIDFTGGTMLQYGFNKEITKDDEGKIRTILADLGIDNPVIQTSAPVVVQKDTVEKQDSMQDSDTEDASQVANNEKAELKTINKYLVSIKTRYLETTSENSEAANVLTALKKEFGEVEVMQTNAIGPTLGDELFKNSLLTLLLAFVGIVIYLAVRFQLDYAMFALLALLHDAIFVIGMFAIFGLLYNTQVS